MNERIQALIEQCTYHYESSDGSGEYETFDKEKFAELIVKECANVCESATQEGQPLHLVSIGYADRIKQHFGVE